MRRRPITEGSIVIHIDGRRGRVLAVLQTELPQAIVRWFGESGSTDEQLAMGYLERQDLEAD